VEARMRLFSVKMPDGKYFVLKEENTIITGAPDIAQWTLGKHFENIIDHFKNYGAIITIL